MTGVEVFARRDDLLAEEEPATPIEPYRRAGVVRALFEPATDTQGADR